MYCSNGNIFETRKCINVHTPRLYTYIYIDNIHIFHIVVLYKFSIGIWHIGCSWYSVKSQPHVWPRPVKNYFHSHFYLFFFFSSISSSLHYSSLNSFSYFSPRQPPLLRLLSFSLYIILPYIFEHQNKIF